jgi:hypothetical protein
MKAEETDIRLAVALKNSALATQMTGAELNQLTESMKKNSTFSDTQIKSAEAMLLTFNHISKQALPDVLQISMDVSKFLGKDFTQTAFTLGRAMQEPANASRLLRAEGVMLSATQTESIKRLIDQNKGFEAQGVLLGLLKDKYGGTAKAWRIHLVAKLIN